MKSKKPRYTHIVAGLMACSTLLSTIVPTMSTYASQRKPDQPSVTRAGQDSTAVNPQSDSADMSAGLSSAASGAVSSSSASSTSNSASRGSGSSATSAKSGHSSASKSTSSSVSSKASSASASSSAQQGQVTEKYVYDGKIVGLQTHGITVGSDIDTSRLPAPLNREYKVAKGKLVRVNTPSGVSTTVSLVSLKQASSARPVYSTRSHAFVEPKRDITPLPSRQVEANRKTVVNPMFRPDNAPRLHTASDFHSAVPMTSADSPRNLKDVKSVGNISAGVLRYKPYMDKVCQHYHMTHYEMLMLAIMQCETGGSGSDVMQSSESVGLSAGSLDPQQSIEQGVKYMAGIVNKAKTLDHAEQSDPHVSKKDYHYYANDDRLLAQTYNYGGNFMDYVAHQKGGYSLAVSQRYSRDVVAPRLGNDDGSTYAYDNPISKMYNKPFLYTNGGNFFYGDLVEQYAVGGYMHTVLHHLIQYSGQKGVFGGADPSQGFDSAGLVSYGLKQVGVHMPNDAVSQWKRTRPVRSGINGAQPGDLVFFKGGHVGFLVDRHTMFSVDKNGVGFHDLDTKYYHDNFAGVRRLPQAGRLNAEADAKLDAEAEQASNGTLKLGALSGTSTDSDMISGSESSASGQHFTPDAVPDGLQRYIHRPQKLGMHYGSTQGWSDPGGECVNFANSYFRAIWGLHRNFVMGNGIDMANAWDEVIAGHLSSTPHAGAIASTDDVGLTGGNPAGHTFIVLHVFKDGSILEVGENWPNESGDDTSKPNTWDYAVLPKSVADSGTQYFMPNTHMHHLHW